MVWPLDSVLEDKKLALLLISFVVARSTNSLADVTQCEFFSGEKMPGVVKSYQIVYKMMVTH